MRIRLVLLAAFGAGMLAAAPEQIGPYRLVATDAGIEVHARNDRRGGTALVGAGLALAALGVWRLRRDEGERRNFAWARIVLGLGLAGVGAFAVLGSGTAWVVTRDGVALREQGRSETIAPRAQIEAVVIASERRDGADVKNAAGETRSWTVQAGGARFALGSREEAQLLAGEIARELGVAVRGP